MNSVKLTSLKPHSDSKGQPTDHLEYRIVSKAAVVCVVFAIMGLLAFVFPAFVILPFLSVCFGIAALVNFRRFPEQLTGRLATKIAMVVGTICLVSSVALHMYIYATEVPDGYQRISFNDLKPEKKTSNVVSGKALEFDGANVFLKGYVRPGLKKNRLKKFILVGDFGSCCFGGSPKITDVVAVTIVDEDQHVNYGYRLRKIGGQFKLHRRPKTVREKDLAYVLYEIEADYVK